MSKTVVRTFGALATIIRTNTDDRRNEVCAEVADALAYIGEKSGQDALFRSALDRIEREAPRGKRGTVSPSATRLINAARNALTAGKLAYSRVQVSNKITDADAWQAECAVIVADFRATAWVARAEPKAKTVKTAMDKAREAFIALSDADRAALIAELAPVPTEKPVKRSKGKPVEVLPIAA